MPTVKTNVRDIIRDKFVTQLSAISLSNNIVRRRIYGMSTYVLGQVIKKIKYAPLPVFSIQFDESTDIANCSQLLDCKRYINDGNFKNEFLYANLLKQ